VVTVARRLLGAGATALVSLGLVAGSSVVTSAPAFAAGQVLRSDSSWLAAVNFYRTESGLPPVVEDPALSAGAAAHARYLLTNQVLVHDEVDGAPGWTPEGDWAGNHSNVAVSGGTTPDRQFVELFMAAPYHALGILRPGISKMGYGRADDTSLSPYKSSAALDILSGYDFSHTTQPVVFPGPGSTIALDRFIAEYPDPRDTCGWSGQQVGLPLVVMLPEAPGAVTATLDGPAGSSEVCVLTSANTTGLAKQLLEGDNAAIIIPRRPLALGDYSARVTTAHRIVPWTFRIDPNSRDAAPAALPETHATAASSRFTSLQPARIADSRTGTGFAQRIPAGTPVRLQVTGTGGVPATATAVSVNVTAVSPDGPGYLTTYPCGAAVPNVSTVNFAGGDVVPNHAVVPLDATGGFCVLSSSSTDVIVDVFGVLSPGGAAGFRPISPIRLADTRTQAPGRLPAGGTLRLAVRGQNGVSASATAVVLNVTAVQPGGSGYVSAHPCQNTAPSVSNLNLSAGQDRPNLVIVPISAGGEVCLTVAETSTDLLVDLAGEMTPDATSVYTPLDPIRIADTRSLDTRLNSGTAGTRLGARTDATVKAGGSRGAPSGIAAMVNVTVADPASQGYVTVHPCGSDRPNTSNVNFTAGQTAANAAIALLDGSGGLCTWGDSPAHVIVDLVGVWKNP